MRRRTPNGVPFTKGNCDGAIDLGDLSGAVQRQFDSHADAADQGTARSMPAGMLAAAAASMRAATIAKPRPAQTQYNTRQMLGDWGNSLPPRHRGAWRRARCSTSAWSASSTIIMRTPTSTRLIAFRTEDATKLYNALYDHYIGITNDGVDHENFIDANVDNRVREKIWAGYAQVDMERQPCRAGHQCRRRHALRAYRRRCADLPDGAAGRSSGMPTTTSRSNIRPISRPVTGKGSYNNCCRRSISPST